MIAIYLQLQDFLLCSGYGFVIILNNDDIV